MKMIAAPALALIAVLLTVSASNAQSFRSCVDELGVRTSAESLIRCLTELSFRLEKAEDEVRRLENRMFSLLDAQETTAVPSGAVMAFDLPGGCPVGWRQYRQLSGRVIIGTGRSGNTDTKDNFLTERELYDRGGQETVTLSAREMPAHTHRQVWGQGAGTANTVASGNNLQNYREATMTQATRSTGGGQPHENMPPFLALHYCIKD